MSTGDEDLKVALYTPGLGWAPEYVRTTDDSGRFIGADLNDDGEFMIVYEQKDEDDVKRVLYATTAVPLPSPGIGLGTSTVPENAPPVPTPMTNSSILLSSAVRTSRPSEW